MGPAHHRQRNTFAGKVLKDKKVYCNRLEMAVVLWITCSGIHIYTYAYSQNFNCWSQILKFTKGNCVLYIPLWFEELEMVHVSAQYAGHLFCHLHRRTREKDEIVPPTLQTHYTIYLLVQYLERYLTDLFFGKATSQKCGKNVKKFFYVSKFAALSQTLWLLKRERAVQLGRSSSG